MRRWWWWRMFYFPLCCSEKERRTISLKLQNGVEHTLLTLTKEHGTARRGNFSLFHFAVWLHNDSLTLWKLTDTCNVNLLHPWIDNSFTIACQRLLHLIVRVEIVKIVVLWRWLLRWAIHDEAIVVVVVKHVILAWVEINRTVNLFKLNADHRDWCGHDDSRDRWNRWSSQSIRRHCFNSLDQNCHRPDISVSFLALEAADQQELPLLFVCLISCLMRLK